ncbi:glycosyltransferase, partial [Burkholderia cenocepacia]|uniref:glycosyltransferase n=1 Tax=Burkholderia cenocepacia TaxID=95486 RepID=UPI00406C0452
MSRHTLKPLVSLVVPFHDEAEAIDAFFATTVTILEAIGTARFEIVCVNDGSRDGTLDKLIVIEVADSRVRIVDLMLRFGKEAELTAGIDESAGAHGIVIDASLED